MTQSDSLPREKFLISAVIVSYIIWINTDLNLNDIIILNVNSRLINLRQKVSVDKVLTSHQEVKVSKIMFFEVIVFIARNMMSLSQIVFTAQSMRSLSQSLSKIMFLYRGRVIWAQTYLT